MNISVSQHIYVPMRRKLLLYARELDRESHDIKEHAVAHQGAVWVGVPKGPDMPSNSPIWTRGGSVSDLSW